MRDRWRREIGRLAGMVMLVVMAGGCVERTIRITSEPSGALVYLNDEEVGRTPVQVPFTHYGVYDVRLEREGCRPMWTKGKAAPPWWDLPGLDLIAELVPGAKSEIHWHFQLEARGEPDSQSLLERAERMRAMVREPAESEPQR